MIGILTKKGQLDIFRPLLEEFNDINHELVLFIKQYFFICLRVIINTNCNSFSFNLYLSELHLKFFVHFVMRYFNFHKLFADNRISEFGIKFYSCFSRIQYHGGISMLF